MKTASKVDFRLIEASIAELRAALNDGIITCVELVAAYLNRIAFYDRHGIRLNSIPLLNPALFDDAKAADQRRAAGKSLGSLDGIPYIAKDSYSVKGLPVANGSPAFEHLIAGDDAFAIARLRAAGAVLIGLTNMPPMAAGGMQRGVYGRAESPYNAHFLAAAYASGSSNGSGTAVAASFAAFGLGEETWSSGRAPASNGGLVAYTPSRGVISVRGNWPLIGTMDVVVPYARSVSDLLEILNILVADDPESRGDFWRVQKAVPIPKSSALRPGDYNSLRNTATLAGKRFGIPRLYINQDFEATSPILTRPSMITLWQQAARDLEALGAEVIAVDFPLVSNYERDRPGARSMVDRGIVPKAFADAEMQALMMFGWDDFLRANGDPKLPSLAAVDGALIFPPIPGAIPDHYEGHPNPAEYPAMAKAGVPSPDSIPEFANGLRGLEETRRLDFENWLTDLQLDGLVFPAVADVAPHDADYNPLSNALAWRNGTWVANGNQAIRHLGIPTVTVPMGMLSDIHMPAGLTFAGKAYDDAALLSYAYAFDSLRRRRKAPPRTPALPSEAFTQEPGGSHSQTTRPTGNLRLTLEASLSPVDEDGNIILTVNGKVTGDNDIDQIALTVNGNAVGIRQTGDHFTATLRLPGALHYALHSRWRGPYGSLIIATVRDKSGAAAGCFTVAGGIV